jgi:sensor histidine kinase YesM
LQKAIAQFPQKVHYLKSQNNIVITKPLNDWKSLFYQRVRWASKTSSYQSTFGKGLGVLVFGGNLCLVLGISFLVFGFVSFPNIFLLFLLKFIVDTVLIYKANHFLNKSKMRYLVLISLLYPFFSTGVALYSLFGKYEWKGRRF